MTCDTQALPGGDTGGVKKTSPMEGDIFFTGDRQTDIHTYIHTHGHCDSMTESAQWADSMKRRRKKKNGGWEEGRCEEDLSNERKGLLHRGQTYRHTHGHCDSMTESAQWADSVKITT